MFVRQMGSGSIPTMPQETGTSLQRGPTKGIGGAGEDHALHPINTGLVSFRRWLTQLEFAGSAPLREEPPRSSPSFHLLCDV